MLNRLAKRFYRAFLRRTFQGVDPALDKRALSLVLEARRRSAAGLHEEASGRACDAIERLCPLMQRLVPREDLITGAGFDVPLTERYLRLRAALEQCVQVLEVSLRGTTHPEEVLKIVREATGLLHSWAWRNTRVFLPVSVENLLNLSFALHAMGRPEAALDLRRQAINLLRKLPRRCPLPFGSLMKLDQWDLLLRELGRHEDALVVARAVTGIMRLRLRRDEPPAFHPDWDPSLMNDKEIVLFNFAGRLDRMGRRLSEMDRPEEALNSTREAVGFFRSLHAARPPRFRREFIQILERLGRLLREAGLPEEALRIEHEAAGLRGQDGR